MTRNICDEFLRVRHNPFQIFKGSKTPAGLYARQKWLNESGMAQWQDDFHQALHALMSGQSDDGSWNQSPLETVRRLFGLHLTIRNQTLEIEKALDWLMRHTLHHSISSLAEPIAPASDDAFRGMPFIPGQTHVSVISMTLFLATVFQKGHEPVVLAHYRLLSLWVEQNAGVMDTASDKMNALRALVVHPDYAEGGATAALVNHLEQIREPSGCWPVPIPFFRTVNALAHLHLEQANRQWNRIPAILCRRQNSDGSWGGEDREWNTFLVVHALKNKGCL
ncbi:MAG: hypothetical protein K4571_09980 [Deltaproteobacteria bacterium]